MWKPGKTAYLSMMKLRYFRPSFMDFRGSVKILSVKGEGCQNLEIQGHLLSSGHHNNLGGGWDPRPSYVLYTTKYNNVFRHIASFNNNNKRVFSTCLTKLCCFGCSATKRNYWENETFLLKVQCWKKMVVDLYLIVEDFLFIVETWSGIFTVGDL